MSSKIGNQQSALLRTLAEHGEMPLPALILSAAVKEGLFDASKEDLPRAVYSNFHRAAGSLEERGLIKVRKGSFSALDELVRWYPRCASSHEKRALRESLLPHIRGFIEQHGRQKKFTPLYCEQGALSRCSPDDHEALTTAWPSASKALHRILARLDERKDPSEYRSTLHALLRGRLLFNRATEGLGVGAMIPSLQYLAQSKRLAGITEVNVLKRFLSRMPLQAYRELRFKGVLYAVATMHTHYPDALDEKFKHHLLEHAPAIVRNLPGHLEPPASASSQLMIIGSLDWLEESRPKVIFSSRLDTLLQRDVFRQSFYRVS